MLVSIAKQRCLPWLRFQRSQLLYAGCLFDHCQTAHGTADSKCRASHIFVHIHVRANALGYICAEA